MIGQAASDFEQIPVDELAVLCQKELQDMSPERGSSTRYRLELFRRAVVERDELAWQVLYEIHKYLVRHWLFRTLLRSSSKQVIHSVLLDTEALINEAFTRFFAAFTPQHFAQCSSLAAVLQYLKTCVRCTAIDAVRAYQSTRLCQPWEDLTEQDLMLDDEAETILSQLTAQHLWDVILSALHSDEERLLVRLLAVPLTPAQISALYPKQFPVKRVYQLHRTIKERLLRNPRINIVLAALRGEADLAQARHFQPLKHPSSGEELVPLPLAEAAQASLCHDLHISLKEAPGCAGHAAQAEQESPAAVTYYQQQVFCGKARCHRCQEGIGHGPYWFASVQVQGRSVRRYLGKHKPPDANTTNTCVTGAPGARQSGPFSAPPIVVYHLQRTRCGKTRCPRCRPGGTQAGHGPYWFAYTTCNGRTIRRYIGKALPPGVCAEGPVARGPLPDTSTTERAYGANGGREDGQGVPH